jgi:RHS repeat-associated protein
MCTRITISLSPIAYLVASSLWSSLALAAPQTMTHTTQFSYIAPGSGVQNAGLVSNETVEPSSSSYCVSSGFTYDTNGNKTQTVVSPCNGTTFSTRTTTVAMDSHNQFPASSATPVIDPAQAIYQKNTFSTDGRFGAAIQQTDPNGLTTSTTLDAAGRSTNVQAKDGSQTITTRYTCISASSEGFVSGDTPLDTQDISTSNCSQMTFKHPVTGQNVSPARYVQTRLLSSDGTTYLGGVTRVYYDLIDREVGTIQTAMDVTSTNLYKRVAKAYDTQGRQAYTSVVHLVDASGALQGSSLKWNIATFDSYGRPDKTYSPEDNANAIVTSGTINDGAYSLTLSSLVGSHVKIRGTDFSTDMQIKNYKVSASSPSKMMSIEEKNAIGQLIRSTDAQSNQIGYQYSADGLLAGTLDPKGNASSITYNVQGQKTDQVDPDLGHWTYSYDALGQLLTQTDANNQQITMAYDQLGRLSSKTTPDLIANYSYDVNDFTDTGESTNSFKAKGLLVKETTSTNYSKYYAYDVKGRPLHIRVVMGLGNGSTTLDQIKSYDAQGRLSTIKYPSNVVLTQQYTSTYGFLSGINRTDNGNQILWQALGLDQFGNIQSWKLGNNLQTILNSDVQGRVTSKTTSIIGQSPTIQNVAYSYNEAGDLATRNDSIDGLSENLYYDDLHRITEWDRLLSSQTAALQVGYSYDAIGNLTYRSDRGNYTYGNGSTIPHALTTINEPAYNGATAQTITQSYDNNGSMLSVVQNGATLRSHSWTSFHMPSSISWNSGTQHTMNFKYDPEFRRALESTYLGGSTQAQKQLIKFHPNSDNDLFFEQMIDSTKSTTENRHFINTPVGVIGTLVTQGSSLSSAKMEYWHTDHLGSVSVITDDNATVVERFQYDPYGQRLTPSGQVVTTSRNTDRGFNQHEHMDDVGLINMNARVFDPFTGRFISADPHITHPTNLQSFNRYSYCLNSPLLCVDPTGMEDENSPSGSNGNSGNNGDGGNSSSNNGDGGNTNQISDTGGFGNNSSGNIDQQQNTQDNFASQQNNQVENNGGSITSGDGASFNTQSSGSSNVGNFSQLSSLPTDTQENNISIPVSSSSNNIPLISNDIAQNTQIGLSNENQVINSNVEANNENSETPKTNNMVACAGVCSGILEGSSIGARAGSVLGPEGTLAGGIIGGVAGGYIGWKTGNYILNQDSASEQQSDKDSSTPSGQRGSPMDVPRGTNSPTTIGEREYSGHALDQMQGRGLTPTPVEDAIQNGKSEPGNRQGTTSHSVEGLTVITNDRGKVVTVITK